MPTLCKIRDTGTQAIRAVSGGPWNCASSLFCELCPVETSAVWGIRK